MRLAATALCDLRCQLRSGLWLAALFVALLLSLLLLVLPHELRAHLLPFLLFSNIQITGFYFMAACDFFERSEGSCEARAVSPLRPIEELASKLFSLTLLSLLEGALLALVVDHRPFALLNIAVGIVATALLFALFGRLMARRYESIQSFLFPSFLAMGFLSLPLLAYFDVAQSHLFWLHPLYAPMLLFTKGSFAALGCSVAWTLLLVWRAVR